MAKNPFDLGAKVTKVNNSKGRSAGTTFYTCQCYTSEDWCYSSQCYTHEDWCYSNPNMCPYTVGSNC